MLTNAENLAYQKILRDELIVAMGCTEPIAVAYACAKAREILGDDPESCVVTVSGNIIKNVKSVVIPNTGGERGLETAAVAGIAVGRSENALQVLAMMGDGERAEMRRILGKKIIRILPELTGKTFYIDVKMHAKGSAHVVIENGHTNITLVEKDGETLYQKGSSSGCADATGLEETSIEKILQFAQGDGIEGVRGCLARQIEYNAAISDEGVKNRWGAAVGCTLLASHLDDIAVRAAAMAAAGSDARMSGCEMPVVLVSGSGNQGLTASVPVIEYAKFLGSTEEQLLRALALADLITIYQKVGIGKLSAFCGATSAGCGAACGIAWLNGYSDAQSIEAVVNNCLAIVSGMVCDGAKPSCAAKIAASVFSGILAYRMMAEGHRFNGGDGILKDTADATIGTVGRIARQMRAVDVEILSIMTE